MKRCCILLLPLALLLSGCIQKESMQKPCALYYLAEEPTTDFRESFMSALIMEADGLDVQDLMRLYFQHVHEEGQVFPFPDGTELKEVSQEGQTLRIVLSDHASELTGVRLSAALACLSRTCFEFIQIEYMEVLCVSKKLGGRDTLILDRQTYCLTDTFEPYSQEET